MITKTKLNFLFVITIRYSDCPKFFIINDFLSHNRLREESFILKFKIFKAYSVKDTMTLVETHLKGTHSITTTKNSTSEIEVNFQSFSILYKKTYNGIQQSFSDKVR